jgi:precorrin-6A/cobalt-precorrin-6A reductase
MNLLILGGTTEASELARALADDARVRATLSLAGRTQRPLAQALPTRIGGFGGVAGLARHLSEQRIDALIDATHPFAARITANAVAAARLSGAKLLVVLRPAWRPAHGDQWLDVADMEEAAAALGTRPRRVLLTVGQKDLLPFRAASQHHYVLRSIDPPPVDVIPAGADFIAARGPFLEEDERRLLLERNIEVMVTKNSGGSATEAKLAAARALGVPVVMVRRPPPPDVPLVADVAQALDWLERLHAAPPRGE